jgi:hypothetical protein
MALRFFTDPLFLALLRFWEQQRGREKMPAWDDALLAGFPEALAPHLIAARFDGAEGTYFYVGRACVERFGTDPTGRRVGDFLQGSILRYIVDLGRAVQAAGAPVFSESLFHIAEGDPIRTGRLFTPFAPDVFVTLQLYGEGAVPLLRYAREGKFEEIARRRIVGLPDSLRQLDEAARLYRLSKAMHIPAVAHELQAAAAAFEATGTEPLPVLT